MSSLPSSLSIRNAVAANGGGAFLAGMLAAKAARENRQLGKSATEAAKSAIGGLQNTLLFLGGLARNGGSMNGVSAFTALGAVKEMNSQLHKLFT